MIPGEDILNTIPQRPPFLFVDEIVERGENTIHCRLHLTGEEDFFMGHFPGNPIMPGVLLQEAAFQGGALLMGKKVDKKGIGVVTKVENAKFKNFVRPKNVLNIKVELLEQLENAFFFKAKIMVVDQVVLNIKFTCALVEKVPGS
ncbi:MAG: beta-hydroxyacyl-ACP dehydratase [Bacteriovoracaceae bacterium]|nr:beta-hydroxyacyl-ACP dehydratase [Bacteriovoracaceae bacterium]